MVRSIVLDQNRTSTNLPPGEPVALYGIVFLRRSMRGKKSTSPQSRSKFPGILQVGGRKRLFFAIFRPRDEPTGDPLRSSTTWPIGYRPLLPPPCHGGRRHAHRHQAALCLG